MTSPPAKIWGSEVRRYSSTVTNPRGSDATPAAARPIPAVSATQPSATGFAEPVSRAFGGLLPASGAAPSEILLYAPLYRLHTRLTRLAERIRRATIRERLAFVFAALVAFLLALGLGQGG